MTIKNLLLYSQAFDNAVWIKNAATITADATTAPDATMTADKMVAPAFDSSGNNVRQTFNLNESDTYTVSVYGKQAELSVLSISATDRTGAPNIGDYDLAVGSATGTGAAIASVGDDWYRCSLTFGSGTGSASSSTMKIGVDWDSGTTHGCYIWGAQAEIGSLTTYQPTVGPTATRIWPG